MSIERSVQLVDPADVEVAKDGRGVAELAEPFGELDSQVGKCRVTVGDDLPSFGVVGAR